MIIKEYGVQNDNVIILLHGGGLSWWNYRSVAGILQRKYHVIIPLLNGHADSDSAFTTIEDNATEIIHYIDKHHHGYVTLIGGLSLGGQILIEIMCQRKNICSLALIESALILPMKITHMLIRPMIELSYRLINKEWFSKLQFRFLKLNKELFDEYYRDSCKITKENLCNILISNSSYKLKNSIKETSAKVCIIAGKKETRKILLSAKKLNHTIKGSSLIIFDGWYHGSASINHPEEYVQIIESLVN